jgi:hypothetical protein
VYHYYYYLFTTFPCGAHDQWIIYERKTHTYKYKFDKSTKHIKFTDRKISDVGELQR